MGGFGSGRPGWKCKTDHLRSIDVNQMHKAGIIQPGYMGSWKWTQNGEKVAGIGTRADSAYLYLSYKVRPNRDDWQDIEEPIALDWVPCHHGGKRPYFLCPADANGRACGRRVVKLYLSGRYFLCRHCQRLAYPSQSEAQLERAMRKANKMRDLLSKKSHVGCWEVKPKGMHWATFWRQVEVIERAEAEADCAFVAMFQRRFPGISL
jgi:hypothetical protein